MDISEITFPVYVVGTRDPIIKDGVSLFLKEQEHEDGSYSTFAYIIDDKNVPGETLGRRRLNIKIRGDQLKKLGKAIFFVGDLIKISRSNVWYIDSKGKLFKYKKSTAYTVEYYEVEKVIPVPAGGSIIAVKGLPCRFKVLGNYYIDPPKYAAIIRNKGSMYIYGLLNEIPTGIKRWRKV